LNWAYDLSSSRDVLQLLAPVAAQVPPKCGPTMNTDNDFTSTDTAIERVDALRVVRTLGPRGRPFVAVGLIRTSLTSNPAQDSARTEWSIESSRTHAEASL
jgi:hypothetical protein